MNTLETLVSKFGKEVGYKVYTCAMVMMDERDGLEDIDAAVRYTIGALKANKRRASMPMSWAKAVELLEAEQMEGRHYNLTSTLNHEYRASMARNDNSCIRIQADGVVSIMGDVSEPKKYVDHTGQRGAVAAYTALCESYDRRSHEETVDVQCWLEEYWHTISATKRQYLRACASDYVADKLSAKQRNNLSLRYCKPMGLNANTLLELLVRYDIA